MANKLTSKRTSETRAAGTNKNSRDLGPVIRQWLRDIFFAVWAIVGLFILTAVIMALLDGPNLLGLRTTATPQTEQTTPQPQTNQPTQDQLDCIANEVGQERFTELNQGQPAEQDEAVIIQNCLAQ
jgi:hypothetical protein